MKVAKSDTTLDIGIDTECPICGENPPYNAKALAAIKEAKAITRGEIPEKWYHSIEESREELEL